MRTLGLQSPAVHDGFATIHGAPSTAGKFSRTRNSSSHLSQHRALPPHSCTGTKSSHCRTCVPRAMEPLWEEKGSGASPSPVVGEKLSTPAVGVSRRERTAPWWDIATRRSRYRSCPTFSPTSVVCALEHTVTSVTDKLERLASSPDLKESEAEELRRTVAALKQHSSAMSHSLSNGLLSLERQQSYDSVSSMSSTLSGGSLSAYRPSPGCWAVAGAGGPLNSWSSSVPSSSSAVSSHPCGPQAGARADSDAENKLKKKSWLRNSFRRAFGRKRSKQSHDPCVDADSKHQNSGTTGATTLFSRLLNNQTNTQTITHDLPVNHCRNAAVSCLSHKSNETQILGTQKGVCETKNGCANGHLIHTDEINRNFASRSFNCREKPDSEHCHQLLPTLNSTLSINPFGLLDMSARMQKNSHDDEVVPNSTHPKGGSKSLDHLDECCRSQPSSVRSSGHYTTDSTELLYPTSCTAALLRDSLQGNSDVSKIQLQEQLAEKNRALSTCQHQLMEAQEQLNRNAETIAGLQAECDRLSQHREQLEMLLRHHLGPAADTLLAAALAALTSPSSDHLENSTSEPHQTCSAIPPYVSSTLPRPSSAGRRLQVKVVNCVPGLVNPTDAVEVQPEEQSSRLVGSVVVSPKTSWTDLDGLLQDVINEYMQKLMDAPCKLISDDHSRSATEESNSVSSVYSSKKPSTSDYISRSFTSKNEQTHKSSISGSITDPSKQEPKAGQESDQVYNQEENEGTCSSSSKSSMFIYCYRIAEVVRAPELLPELLPYGYCVGNVTEIYLWLKGAVSKAAAIGEDTHTQSQKTRTENSFQDPNQNSNISGAHELTSKKDCVHTPKYSASSAISFFSNIPQETILSLSSALRESHRLLICGPSGSGKTSLVKALSRYVSASYSRENFFKTQSSSNENYTQNTNNTASEACPEEDPVIWFTVSGTNSLQLCHLLTSIVRQSSYSNASEKSCRKFSDNSGIGNCLSNMNSSNTVNFSSNVSSNNHEDQKPLRVIVIEDIHQGCGIAETIERCLSGYSDVAFLVTSQQPMQSLANLCRVCGFRYFELRLDREPVRGLLGRALRRRVLDAELKTKKPLPQMDIITTWLQQLWFYLNTVTLAPSDAPSPHSNVSVAQSPAFLPRSLQRSPGAPLNKSGKLSGKFTPCFVSSTRGATESCHSNEEFSKEVSFSRTNLGTTRCHQAAELSFSSSENSKLFLSPSVFMDCPMDLIMSQKWFLKTWNYSVIPQIKKILSSSPKNSVTSNGHFKSNSESDENFPCNDYSTSRFASNRFHREGTHSTSNVTDPLQWVLSTYPWPASVDFGSHNLVSLREINAPLPRSQHLPFICPAPPTPTLPPKEKSALKNEDIYAVPSVESPSKFHLAPLHNNGIVLTSSFSNSDRLSSPARNYGKTTAKRTAAAAICKTDPKLTAKDGSHDTSCESVGQDIPSSMALIVPFSTVTIKNKEPNYSVAVSAAENSHHNGVVVNSYDSSTGYVLNYGSERPQYKPLKSFGNHSKSDDSSQPSKAYESPNSECVKASNSLTSSPNESKCTTKDTSRPNNIGRNKLSVNSATTCDNRLSGSHSSGSDEIMTSLSSSPATVPNEPIYFTIQKESGKSESPEDSDMDTEPIYFTIPGDHEETSTQVQSETAGIENSANFSGNVDSRLPYEGTSSYHGYNMTTDTVVISCRQDSESKSEVKNTTRALTSTFKPFETIM